MDLVLAAPTPAFSAVRLITDAPHVVVVVAVVVLAALVILAPWAAYRWFHRREPREEMKRIDPVFGEVRYHPEILYWRGRALFAPLDREVAVDVGDDDEGPFASQRAWYQELEQRYPALQSEVRELVSSSSGCSESFEALQLNRVSFPDHSIEDVKLALGYTSSSTRWAYWVTVESWSPLDFERVKKEIWERLP